jgi:lipoprotein-anchoring transpeptidase ErfK/SrfK
MPHGGAPMPYCMFFNGSQGLHGSYEVVDGNASHGCVRMTVSDAEWVRFNFATIGTKVVVRPYN